MNVFPTEEVLKSLLGNGYESYSLLMDKLTAPGLQLMAEWRYYTDGYAWLCKVTDKKKTVFWLSAWNGFFKTSFYFAGKHLEAIMQSGISESLKEQVFTNKTIGRLIPVTLSISRTEQLEELMCLVHLKRSLK